VLSRELLTVIRNYNLFFFLAKMLIAEINFYRGPYNSNNSGGGEAVDLTLSRVNAMSALLDLQPKDDLATAMTLLGKDPRIRNNPIKLNDWY
jgi:hypothetical protein